MKKLEKPKVFRKRTIIEKGKEIGLIQLVKYLDGFFSIAHIEFKLNSKFQRKGIMRKELRSYLRSFWFKPRLIATTYSYHNNVASEKLLLENGFKHAFDYKKTSRAKTTLRVFALNVDLERVKKEIELLKK